MKLHATVRQASYRSETGQAMVEFMIVVVVLFLLFVSIIQVMFLMYTYSTLADAAKEGVRYAIVHGTGNSNCSGPGTAAVTCSDTTGNNVKTIVTNFANLSFQNVTNVAVDYNPNSANGTNPCNIPGCMVRVTVSHDYAPFFLPWPTVTINAAADGRIMN